MQVHFIDTEEQLTNICQQFSNKAFLAIDTEFVRNHTYYPILALIQICDGEQIALIDPVALDDLSPLMKVLYDESITKVLHSARQDLEILYCMNEAVPKNIFDTQIAAALLGFGEQIGYAALVKQLLRIELDKSQTRTDWLKRPLSKKQLLYAADDVRHLAKVYPLQKSRLEQQGRLAWLKNDFGFLSSVDTYKPTPDTIWRKIKGVNRLKPLQLAIIQQLCAWREQEAVKLNKPRRRILHDEVLIELALNPPENMDELQEIRGLHKKVLQPHGKTLMALILKGLQTPREKCPALPHYEKLTEDEEALADCLMAVIHLSASSNRISAKCLSTRKEIDALIKGKRELSILTGWRNELVGKDLLEFLSGNKQLIFCSGKLQLQEANH
jgi:ribonuclease D